MKAKVTSYRAMQYEFPFTPPSLNTILAEHPLTRAKRKKRFIQDMTMEIRSQGTIEFSGQVRIIIDLCFTNKRRRDPDNYLKFVLDGLVKSGVILDDSKEIIPDPPDLKIYDCDPEEKMIIKVEEI